MMILSQYLILSIADNHFAVNVQNITDVIKQSRKTPVPLSNPNIHGVMNLRGHIVTEINVASTLAIPQTRQGDGFSVVINKEDELYSFIFDKVGDVIEIGFSEIEPLPETIQKSWHQLSKGVYKLQDKLVVLLDLSALIDMMVDVEMAHHTLQHA